MARRVDAARQRFGPAAFTFGVKKKFGDDRAPPGPWRRRRMREHCVRRSVLHGGGSQPRDDIFHAVIAVGILVGVKRSSVVPGEGVT
jgi:hypothetical protein